MLIDFQQPFVRMTPLRASDGCGGTEETWQDTDDLFLGGVTDADGSVQSIAGLAHLRTRTMLIHEAAAMLHAGDRIRDLLTDQVYRVLGDSDDHRTPACAVMACACVPVEKVVAAR